MIIHTTKKKLLLLLPILSFCIFSAAMELFAPLVEIAVYCISCYEERKRKSRLHIRN